MECGGIEFKNVELFVKAYNSYVKSKERIGIKQAMEELDVYSKYLSPGASFTVKLRKEHLDPKVNKLAVFFFNVTTEDGKRIIEYVGHD
ncbi:hypothetical protein [Listeria costaricensis]|uniref:hypothetical protein n=1 Tax=Listeria costaricensis TaxID=2026604 RepID=UPI000C08BD0A|nr:hypothetical protein [Listeria costaricensis]